jgi:hypothetical protein
MAGCNPRKCSPKKLCFNCAQRVCDEREAQGLPRYQTAHTGRWSGSRLSLENVKITIKTIGETGLKIAAVGEVLRALPLLEDQCRRAGLFETALEIRKAVQRSGFEAEKLFGKWIKEDDKKKKKAKP